MKATGEKVREVMEFWAWLRSGSGRNRIINMWLLLDGAIGLSYLLLGAVTLKDAAGAVLLPLLATMVGVSFAWVSSAHSILTTPEIRELASHTDDGVRRYVFIFQLAMLVAYCGVAYWGLCALGVWECIRGTVAYRVAGCIGLALASLVVRTSWKSVGLVGQLVISHTMIRGELDSQDQRPTV